VFILAIPIQIILALITMSIVLSSIALFWLSEFEEGMVFFLSQGGP
jgi:flagellar biosynthesis protein FliR